MQLCRVGITTTDSSRRLSATIIDPLDSYNIYYRSTYQGTGSSYGNMSPDSDYIRLGDDGILLSQGLWTIEVLFSEKDVSTLSDSAATNYVIKAKAENVYINLNTKSIAVTIDTNNSSKGALRIDSYSLQKLPATVVTDASVSVSLYKYNGSTFEETSDGSFSLSYSEDINTYYYDSISNLDSGIYYAVFKVNGTVSGNTGVIFTDFIGFIIRSGITTILTGECEYYNEVSTGDGQYLVGPVVPSDNYGGNTIEISSGDYAATSENQFKEIKDGCVYEFTDNIPHVDSDLTDQRIPTPAKGTSFAINLKGKDLVISMDNGNTTSESALFTTLQSNVLLTIFNNNSDSPNEATFLDIEETNSAHKKNRRLQTNIELNGPDLTTENAGRPTLNVIGEGALESISNSSIIFLGPDADNCETGKTLLSGETKQGSINLSGSGGNVTLDGSVELQGFVGISSWSTTLTNDNLTPTITYDIGSTIKILNGAKINVTGDVESDDRYSDDAQGIAIYAHGKGGEIEIILDNGSITTNCASSNATLSSSTPESGIMIDSFTGSLTITLKNNSSISSTNGNGIVLRNCTGDITINYDSTSSIYGAYGALSTSNSSDVKIYKDGTQIEHAMTSRTFN